MKDSIFHRELLGEAQGGRAAFFERLRIALHHDAAGQAPAERPAVDDALVRQVAAAGGGTDGDQRERLTARWMAYATGNGMQVDRVMAEGLADAMDAALEPYRVRSLLLNCSDFEEKLALRERFGRKGITVTRWGDDHCRKEAFAADASITDCRYGMADTGSLMVWSDAGFGRSSTLTTPVHLVVLCASRILPDLVDALPHAAGDNGGRMPSNIVIINGPSKTADIEMNLVTGVHGPKFLHVLVVMDL